jgi:hypothetical protein
MEPSCGGGGEREDEYLSAIANIASRRRVGMRRRRRLNGDEEEEELADLGDPGDSHVVCLFDDNSINFCWYRRKCANHLPLFEDIKEGFLVDHR